MAVSNAIKVLQGVYQGHQSGQSPTITAADFLQFSKKYSTANHLLDAAASTTSEDSILTATPNYASGILIFGVWVLPSAAVTANGATFATLTIGTRPQAGGGSQTPIGTALTTATVSWVANSQTAVFTSTPGIAVAQNLVVTCAITKASTGVVIPQLTYFVEWAEA